MKIYNAALAVSLFLLQPLQGYEECSHYYNIGNIYHHGDHILCLRKAGELSQEQLTHIFDAHLMHSVMHLELANQPNLTEDHLKQIAGSSCSKRIVSLNLSNCPKIGYNGLLALWKSSYVGSIREDEPIYFRYDNTPISLIKVQIAGCTRAFAQYEGLRKKDGNKIFPLPIRDDFEINYTCPSGGHIVKTVAGYKELVLYEDKLRIDDAWKPQNT